ncbi:hypothetical protein DERP_004998 [Dermatophagoides pteronyssinus]|uniref:Uncharacterized protein n=1 Tax=Dermatophagoides pteronyssinus TaxID=6956 RepID=A0ABQ8JT26_DERPT|nr:hypothetical protein DERP_004998 [Dermatophagoides pteronyssinus]
MNENIDDYEDDGETLVIIVDSAIGNNHCLIITIQSRVARYFDQSIMSNQTH